MELSRFKPAGAVSSVIGLMLVFHLPALPGGTIAPSLPTRFVAGPDTGLPPQVNKYDNKGTSTGSFFPEATNFTGGVRVAMGDVSGRNDIITGAGPGGGPHVRVFSGSGNTPVFSFDAFPGFNGGIFVAAGDVNGDGRADIIVGMGDANNSVPQVRVFSGANGTTVLHDFVAFDPTFRGGVRVATGDVNGDGTADIIVGTGPGAGQVAVFNGKNLGLLANFSAFPGFTGGVYVAAGDINGDGFDDIIVGAGSGGPHVKAFSGNGGAVLKDFFPFSTGTGGVRVAATDLNNDGKADFIVGAGKGDPSRVRAFDSTTLVGLADFAPYGTSTAGVFVGAIPRFPAQSLNLSTRLKVLTGDNALVGGFIITGNDPKQVIIRGLGPSTGVPGALSDPTLQLFSGNTETASNNNWKDSQQTAIEQTGIPPTNELESAIVQTLNPGNYTAVLRGNGGATGIGLIEVYDLNATTSNSQLGNISTRGFVQTGDDVMIGGLILGGGTGANKMLVRGLGPSLAAFGVANPLADPRLGLFNSQGVLLMGNDNWKESQEADIAATGIPPSNDSESALIALLPPGNYTAIIAGVGGATGIGLVEVYNLQ